MKPSIRGKLDRLAERFEEITALLADAETQNDTNRFRELGRGDPILANGINVLARPRAVPPVV